MSIPGLDPWIDSPQGRHVLDWEQATINTTVADIFGYNALQLGLPRLDLLAQNRIPFRQKAGDDGAVDTVCDLRQLPFSANSIDLALLPHVLEFYDDPHQILREVERVLIPGGKVVITGFNPLSMWGVQQKLMRERNEFPWCGTYLSAMRVRDWLQLLGFEIDRTVFGCHTPACSTEKWLHRWQFIETAGRRSWKGAGGIYLICAIKRVHGMRLVMPGWKKTAPRAKALSPIAQKESPRGQ